MPFPQPPQTDLVKKGDTIKDRWKIKDKLGKGGFGQIFQAYDKKLGHDVAVKVEALASPHQALKMEVAVLRRLDGKKHVCKFYGSGRTKAVNFVVMSVCGKNLGDLRRTMPQAYFSVSTSFRLGVQMIEAIQVLHGIGFLHRDIKPPNFAMGIDEEKRNVIMLDFGLARQYVSSTGEVRPARDTAGFRGTVRYASVTSHLEKEMGRRDDMWSLFYVIVEFCNGTLPWRHVREKEEVGKLKQDTTTKQLCASLPDHVIGKLERFSELLLPLKYSDVPNYAELIKCLTDGLESISVKESDPFDWEADFKKIIANEEKEHTKETQAYRQGSSSKAKENATEPPPEEKEAYFPPAEAE